MIKSLFAAAALIAVPAIAQAEEAKSTFTYQGVDYTYTAAQEGNVKVLRGTALNGTAPFELRVTKSGVSGTFDSQPVNFPLREVKHIDAADIAVR